MLMSWGPLYEAVSQLGGGRSTSDTLIRAARVLHEVAHGSVGLTQDLNWGTAKLPDAIHCCSRTNS